METMPAPTTKRVLLAAPRGYCAGVDRAVIAVEKALELHGAPVYVRKEIVHNKYVVETLSERGAIFVDETDEVPEGERVVFSAHGVSPAVRAAADARSLQTIDATCPLVTKVHKEAIRFARDGRTILLIGHTGHEEVEGTAGEAPDHTIVVNSPRTSPHSRWRIPTTSCGSRRPRCRSTRRWRRCAACASASPRCRTRRATTFATRRRTARWR
ncbi:hypothetical protein GCM10025873_16310 [Demequina sediminis]|nr:hypothetical protein GCM10025873_16310 [Demequina sediminis]